MSAIFRSPPGKSKQKEVRYFHIHEDDQSTTLNSPLG
jgi:hypothetical protein